MSNSSIAPPLEVALEIGRAVEEVQSVFLAFTEKEKLLTVHTIVPERDRSVCRRVYTIEQHIIDRYPDFDFAFCARKQRSRATRYRQGPWHVSGVQSIRARISAAHSAPHSFSLSHLQVRAS
jgi:hypothetical protein